MAQTQPPTQLTPELRNRFHEHGYLVIPGLFEQILVAKLRDRIDAIAQGAAPLPQGVMRMEEPSVARKEVRSKGAVGTTRKLEGVPLATDAAIKKAAHHPRLVAAMQELLGPDLKLLRAAAMMKPPKIGSPKGIHQDVAYYPIEPMEHIAAWIALDPATEENGCMEVLPGAHKDGYREHEMREYDTDLVIQGTTGDEEGLVTLPMQPGDVLLTHCLTPHRSGANTTSEPRRALILAYMSAKSRYTVSEEERPPWVQSLPICGEEHEGCV